MDLRDKVVIITGASGGIGLAAAREFSRHGAKLVLVSRRKEILETLASELGNSLVCTADLSDEKQAADVITYTLASFGRIDILINNAASIIVSASEVVSREDLLKAFSTNLLGPVTLTQKAIPHMIQNGGGHIINVGSPGFMMGIPFYSPYVCAKAAFSAWTRTIQAEWKGSSIRVSEYFPGYIRTDSDPESRLGLVHQDFLMKKTGNIITQYFTRPGTPQKVAKHLVSLALRPKPLMYSDISTRIGAIISNFSRFRLSIASEMAGTARKKQNLIMFKHLNIQP